MRIRIFYAELSFSVNLAFAKLENFAEKVFELFVLGASVCIPDEKALNTEDKQALSVAMKMIVRAVSAHPDERLEHVQILYVLTDAEAEKKLEWWDEGSLIKLEWLWIPKQYQKGKYELILLRQRS